MKMTTPRKLLLVLTSLVVLIALIGLFIGFGGINKTKRIYYGHKAETALRTEYDKLGGPWQKLGFTNIQGGSSKCVYSPYGDNQQKYVYCSATYKTYKVFIGDTDRQKATTAAVGVSEALEQNGWHRGNYELAKWFKDVLYKVDYNPDAYHYKFYGNTLCVADFFVAYSNPNPPAVTATFDCTTPVSKPPTL